MKESEAGLNKVLKLVGLKTETQEEAIVNHNDMMDNCEACLVAMNCECREELIIAIKTSSKSFNQIIKDCPRGWEGEDHGEMYRYLLTENTHIPVSEEQKVTEVILSPGVSCDINNHPQPLRSIGPFRISGRTPIQHDLINLYLDHNGRPKNRYLKIPTTKTANSTELSRENSDYIESDKQESIRDFGSDF